MTCPYIIKKLMKRSKKKKRIDASNSVVKKIMIMMRCFCHLDLRLFFFSRIQKKTALKIMSVMGRAESHFLFSPQTAK